MLWRVMVVTVRQENIKALRESEPAGVLHAQTFCYSVTFARVARLPQSSMASFSVTLTLILTLTLTLSECLFFFGAIIGLGTGDLP